MYEPTSPQFPEGTPKYAAYAAALRTELAKFAAGDAPYEYQRPDPTKTGPCELKLSFTCTGAGYERLDPRDMLARETSFREPKISCIQCYEMAADIFIERSHR